MRPKKDKARPEKEQEHQATSEKGPNHRRGRAKGSFWKSPLFRFLTTAPLVVAIVAFVLNHLDKIKQSNDETHKAILERRSGLKSGMTARSDSLVLLAGATFDEATGVLGDPRSRSFTRFDSLCTDRYGTLAHLGTEFDETLRELLALGSTAQPEGTISIAFGQCMTECKDCIDTAWTFTHGGPRRMRIGSRHSSQATLDSLTKIKNDCYVELKESCRMLSQLINAM